MAGFIDAGVFTDKIREPGSACLFKPKEGLTVQLFQVLATTDKLIYR